MARDAIDDLLTIIGVTDPSGGDQQFDPTQSGVVRYLTEPGVRWNACSECHPGGESDRPILVAKLIQDEWSRVRDRFTVEGLEPPPQVSCICTIMPGHDGAAGFTGPSDPVQHWQCRGHR